MKFSNRLLILILCMVFTLTYVSRPTDAGWGWTKLTKVGRLCVGRLMDLVANLRGDQLVPASHKAYLLKQTRIGRTGGYGHLANPVEITSYQEVFGIAIVGNFIHIKIVERVTSYLTRTETIATFEVPLDLNIADWSKIKFKWSPYYKNDVLKDSSARDAENESKEYRLNAIAIIRDKNLLPQIKADLLDSQVEP